MLTRYVHTLSVQLLHFGGTAERLEELEMARKTTPLFSLKTGATNGVDNGAKWSTEGFFFNVNDALAGKTDEVGKREKSWAGGKG